jgi:hypothetical protein
VVLFAIAAFAIVNAQGTEIGWYLTPVYPSTALAAAVAITRVFHNPAMRAAAVLLAIILAVPAVINGREALAKIIYFLTTVPRCGLFETCGHL